MMTLRAWEKLGVPSEVVTGPPLNPVRRLLDVPARAHAEVVDDRSLAARVARIARGSDDVVHIRHYSTGLSWREISKRVPFSLEIHAPLLRPERTLDAVRVAKNALTWPALSAFVSGAAAVTRELSEDRGWRSITEMVVLGNGIDLSPTIPDPPAKTSRPRLVLSVGSAAAWHGLDRLAVIARSTSLDVRVVCPEGVAPGVSAELANTGVSVIATKSLAEYRSVLLECDAAIGTLALERKKLTEAAPLKVRDYVDLAIPTALPYHDTNLSAASKDPAIFPTKWDASYPAALEEWVHGIRGARLAQSTRELVDIDGIEQRRVAMLRRIA